MTTYLLHGGFTRAINDSNRSFFDTFAQRIDVGGTILIVLFASTEKKEERYASFVHLIQERAPDKSFNFECASEENFIDQVNRADGIYFHGGSTQILLSVVRKFSNLKEMLKGKVIAGSSAGAYFIATYGAAHTGEHMRAGLGMLPIRLICHFESQELPPSSTSVKELMEADGSLALVCLKDYEWKMIEEE